jgi:hypothetical protein
MQSASSTSASASVTPIGVLQGQNPLIYSAADPFILFTVQVPPWGVLFD